MDLKTVIKNRKNKNSFSFKIVNEDAVILTGRYKDMYLSDIFIVNPYYLDWIINFKGGDEELKMVAKSIKNKYKFSEESINREIALS